MDLGDIVAEHIQRHVLVIDEDEAKLPDLKIQYRFYLYDQPDMQAFSCQAVASMSRALSRTGRRISTA